MKFPLEQNLSPHTRTCRAYLVLLHIFCENVYSEKTWNKKNASDRHSKGKKLHTVETLMSIATVGVVIAQLFSITDHCNYMPSGARFTGFLIGILGDVIFLVSVVTMKDSWRAGIPEHDKTELVTDGIYAFQQKPPLFSASTLCTQVCCSCISTRLTRYSLCLPQ